MKRLREGQKHRKSSTAHASTPKRISRIFISHSSTDKEFATLVADILRSAKSMEPWIDSEQILVGDDILEHVGEGLKTMDLLIFLVSAASLKSRWVDRELKFAAAEDIRLNQIRIMPFIVDATEIAALPWYLRHQRAEYVSPDNDGALKIVGSVTKILQRRSGFIEQIGDIKFQNDSRIDFILKDIGPGEWKAAEHAALAILEHTNNRGENDLFERLLTYQDSSDEKEAFWAAMLVIESCADLSPPLVNHEILSRMAQHKNFSVRSTAASICLRFAQYAPQIVPIDLLITLSVYDEDWYVERPAVAALQSMAGSVPAAMAIFYSRLQSSISDEREHAAQALVDIAKKEPGLLDPDDLQHEISRLQKTGDNATLNLLRKAAQRARRVKRANRYKYAL